MDSIVHQTTQHLTALIDEEITGNNPALLNDKNSIKVKLFIGDGPIKTEEPMFIEEEKELRKYGISILSGIEEYFQHQQDSI